MANFPHQKYSRFAQKCKNALTAAGTPTHVFVFAHVVKLIFVGLSCELHPKDCLHRLLACMALQRAEALIEEGSWDGQITREEERNIWINHIIEKT